uniref:CCHamide-1 neuropeptide n=1 Tax=Glossina palpalis gambiensis TaxID=67801 RepID=A0A1B0C685_9MUSC
MYVATGSCLEYGHSCWGAHGKRSGRTNIFRSDVNLPTVKIDFPNLNALKDQLDRKLNYGASASDIDMPLERSLETHGKRNINPSVPVEQTYVRNELLKQVNKNIKTQAMKSFRSKEYNNDWPKRGQSWVRFPLYQYITSTYLANNGNNALSQHPSIKNDQKAEAEIMENEIN